MSLVVLAAGASCLALLFRVPLPGGFDLRPIVPGGVAIGLAVAVLVAAGVTIAAMVRRAAQLDAVFMPLGIAGRRYRASGRQYHGTFAGRRVAAYFSRGPHFALHLATPLQTRFSVAEAGPGARGRATSLGRRPLELAGPDWAGYTAAALDDGWLRRLLVDPAASQALRSLLSAGGGPGAAPYEVRQVTLEPGGLAVRWLHTDAVAITTERLNRALSDLAALARAAEALPPAQVRAEATPLERLNPPDRDWLRRPALAVAGAGLGALILVAIVVALVLLGRQ